MDCPQVVLLYHLFLFRKLKLAQPYIANGATSVSLLLAPTMVLPVDSKNRVFTPSFPHFSGLLLPPNPPHPTSCSSKLNGRGTELLERTPNTKQSGAFGRHGRTVLYLGHE